jgi:hypothetical protein
MRDFNGNTEVSVDSRGHSKERRGFLNAMSLSEFFSHRRGPFKDIDKIQDRNGALQKALDFEKATLGSFRTVVDFHAIDELLIQVSEA